MNALGIVRPPVQSTAVSELICDVMGVFGPPCHHRTRARDSEPDPGKAMYILCCAFLLGFPMFTLLCRFRPALENTLHMLLNLPLVEMHLQMLANLFRCDLLPPSNSSCWHPKNSPHGWSMQPFSTIPPDGPSQTMLGGRYSRPTLT